MDTESPKSKYAIFAVSTPEPGYQHIWFYEPDTLYDAIPEIVSNKLCSWSNYETYILLHKKSATHIGKNVEDYYAIIIPSDWEKSLEQTVFDITGPISTFEHVLNNGIPDISVSKFTKVIENGTFYYPATKHYDNKKGTIVSCDRCGTRDPPATLGFEQMDLCVNCLNVEMGLMPMHKKIESGLRDIYKKKVLEEVKVLPRDVAAIKKYFEQFMKLEPSKPSVGYRNYVGFDYVAYNGTTPSGKSYTLNIVIHDKAGAYYVHVMGDMGFTLNI